MQVRIHRGTREIGGTCIEIDQDGARLLLDLGLPLNGDPADVTIHPIVEGLDGSGNLLALILSHGHLDHVGLAHLTGPALPVVLGEATLRLMRAAAPFVPGARVPTNTLPMADRRPLRFGPFKVTPLLVDHSAYDAYALLVEADGERLLYSGDLRGHGRKAALFERLLREPPRDVDILLMEGSSLGRLNPDQQFPSEAEIESIFVEEFRRTDGLSLVLASAQNIDRMVTLYRAAKRTGRTLIIDIYAAEILRATGNPNIPQSHWANVAVFVPHYQRVQIKRTGRFDLLEPHGRRRIYLEALGDLAKRAVFLFRPAMLRDLDQAGCLSGARAIWSQWEGYLAEDRGRDLLVELSARDIPLIRAHTSGHASIRDLRRLVEAVAPRRLIPIHTFEAARFPDLFGPSVDLKSDGEWWRVAA